MFNRLDATAEIAERNQQRMEAKLPLLSAPDELARLKDVHEAVAFETFVRESHLLRQRIWNRQLVVFVGAARISIISPRDFHAWVLPTMSGECFGASTARTTGPSNKSWSRRASPYQSSDLVLEGVNLS
jgi:hypothetical protein